MNIDTMIKQLTKIREEHGNLLIFNENYNAIDTITSEVVDSDDFPKSWNLPEKLVIIA